MCAWLVENKISRPFKQLFGMTAYGAANWPWALKMQAWVSRPALF
jgi:hypothetical protein